MPQKINAQGKGLGRRAPTDREHLTRYPFRVELNADAFVAERRIPVPTWCRTVYDQGDKGACVGYSFSKTMSILNEAEERSSTTPVRPYKHQYDAEWLWDRAKEIDEWDDTNPGDNEGTSLRAALEILKSRGHRRILRRPDPDVVLPESQDEGVLEYRWAQRVDDIRAALALGIPVVFGMDWYDSFFTPEIHNNEYWIARGSLGPLSGGHAIMAHRVSDRRQAFGLSNTWGYSYPACVWMPFSYVEQELSNWMECALVTDRVSV